MIRRAITCTQADGEIIGLIEGVLLAANQVRWIASDRCILKQLNRSTSEAPEHVDESALSLVEAMAATASTCADCAPSVCKCCTGFGFRSLVLVRMLLV